MTLIQLIERCSARLDEAGVSFGHGTTNAFDEAAWLVLWALGRPLDALDDHADDEVDAPAQAQALALVEQRIATRRPAAYLTGEAWLQGVPFTVDERVIVPRSPISELLAEGLAPWIEDPDAVGRVLDLCTGSGCLAILAAHAFGNAAVDAVDVSADALAVAQSNIELHGLQDRVQALRSDLLAQVPADRRYDLIVCNPPYVNERSMKALPPEYRHEPRLALAGGAEGMDLVRRILADAPDFMAPEGLLVLEIGHERAHFEAAFPELEPLWLDTAATTGQILLLRRAQLAP